MPRFNGFYDNYEIAAVVSYVRQAWDNDAGPVSPEQVAEVRNRVEANVEAQEEGPTPTPPGQAPSNVIAGGTPGLATPEGAPPVSTPPR
jgi:hypothetical protein